MKSIRTKLVVTLLIIALIPSFTIGLLCYFSAKSALKESCIAGLHTTAEFKEGELFLYLDKIKGRTIDFSSDGFIRRHLEKIITTKSKK